MESGEGVRIDSTVTEPHILAPADSRPVFDGIRVLTRPLASAHQCLGDPVSYTGIIVEPRSGAHCRRVRNATL